MTPAEQGRYDADTASTFPSLAINKDRQPPYLWAQWKGTQLCADVHCTCGAHLHLDADFAYHIACPYCSQVYEVDGFITLHPIARPADRRVIVVPKDPLGDDFDTDDDEDQQPPSPSPTDPALIDVIHAGSAYPKDP